MLLRYLFPVKAEIQRKLIKRRIIVNPRTIGERILDRRLELGLLQVQVAKIIGVCTDTVTNWENDRGEPQIQVYPKIIKFLGYFPFDIDTSTLGGKIKEYRYLNGLTQERIAKELGVDESTVFHYENGKHKPLKITMEKLKEILEKWKVQNLHPR